MKKLSDAKSRYEIIDELTDKKLEILDTISNLNDRVLGNKAGIEKQERDNQRKIEDMQANNELNEEAIEKQKLQLQLKATAIVEAVDAIKAISANNEKAKGK